MTTDARLRFHELHQSGIFILPNPWEIVQIPGRVLMFFEEQHLWREIWTDGRAMPKDPDPSWLGYSVGHWEGDTLVVETVGFRDDVWLDVQGSPLTGQAKLTERFKRLNYGSLQIDVTIEDPTAYTRPFTVRVNQKLYPDAELIEFICNENEKSARHFDR